MSRQEDCRIVVLGGYGHFGARIVRALAATPGIAARAAHRASPSSPPGAIRSGRRR